MFLIEIGNFNRLCFYLAFLVVCYTCARIILLFDSFFNLIGNQILVPGSSSRFLSNL